MGRKKDAKKGPKLPKEIAGVKLPKPLRRKGEALIARAASPEGQAAIAKGLTAAAALANLAVERGKAARAAAAPTTAGATRQPAAAPANDAQPPNPAKPVLSGVEGVAEAVSTVADAVLGRLFGGRKA